VLGKFVITQRNDGILLSFSESPNAVVLIAFLCFVGSVAGWGELKRGEYGGFPCTSACGEMVLVV
jgi:hypothetical protein